MILALKFFYASSYSLSEHVCVECVDHALAGVDNSASWCLQWSYIDLYYSSLIDVGVMLIELNLHHLATLIYLFRFACFTASFTTCLSVKYAALVSSMLLFFCIIGSSPRNDLHDVIV